MTRAIAELIRQGFEQLTPSERKAARVLLTNYPVPGLQTVAQFAKQAEVSNPTILRLVDKLGFGAYSEFQQRLRDELESRLRSPLTKNTSSGPRDSEDNTGFLNEFRQSIVEIVNASLQDIVASEFDGAVQLLTDIRRPVSLIGGRLTSSLALQCYLHLRAVRPRVTIIDRQTETWAEHLLDVGPRDVLIVFDIRRYQDDVVRYATEASKRGASLILFTDQWVSPIAGVARHVFAMRTATKSSWDSFTAISALIEAIVSKVTSQRWPDVKHRMEQLETVRSQLAQGQLGVPTAP
jgi:DNA-binding MurR/RpiR family transcriptional regulator